ncbi:MAG: aminopeptidase P family protein [Lentisphaerae bacterium]|nr:aminopeptidase P family protein [Lentisphaerota bacterium]
MSKLLFSESDYRQRRQGVLRRARAEHGVEALLITNATDIRYLSGCTEGSPALLFGRDWATLFTSRMFLDCIRVQAPGVDVVLPQGPLFEQAHNALNRKKHRRAIGFQGNDMSWPQHQTFAAAMGRRRQVDIGETVITYRAVKDEQEIRLTRKCVRIAEQALLSMVSEGLHAFVGRTEKRLAAELEYRMRQLGTDRQGFPVGGIIAAAGANSASCHHFPSDHKVRRGEPLLFDWGAELHGYRSDITRVLFMGTPRPKMAEVYKLVYRANQRGTAAIRPGVATHSVARQAWDIIRDGGYGDNIRHGLGHGIGLDIHEAPRLGTGSQPQAAAVRLRRNMIVTIEPGIYLKGLGGIRIEDDVRVTEGGHDCLTRFPREIEKIIIG